jgi:hypothetical protein
VTSVAAERMPDIGAGLRDVIEAVWRPEQTGVAVSLGAARRRQPHVESYFILPHPSRPRLLLPADDVRSARRALGAYRGLRTGQAEAWARLIRASVLSSPTASRLLRQLHVHAGPEAETLLPQLAALLDYPGRLLAMLAVRQPGPSSKATIGLLDEAGRPVAFAKLGSSEQTDMMVRNEALALSEVKGRLPTIFTSAVRAETTWHGHPVTVMAPLPLDARRLTVEPLRMPQPLLEVASSGDFGDREVSGSSYANRLMARLETCAPTHREVADALMRWCRQLCDPPGQLRFGRSHGDWVSWNLGTHRGRLVVWDWEQSVRDAPVGFDACHWYFQRSRAHRGFNAAVAAVDAVAPGLVRLGVRAEDTARVADLYLLETCVGGLELPASAGSEGDVRAFAELARRRVDR